MPKLLPIRILGERNLRKKLNEADLKDPDLMSFLEDLTHTMYERDGVGLAANQVGADKLHLRDRSLLGTGKCTAQTHRDKSEIIEMEGEQVYEGAAFLYPIYMPKFTAQIRSVTDTPVRRER